MFSAVIDSLIIEIEPALLTSYLSNVLAVSIHLFPTGNYHLTIHIANGVDNDMSVHAATVCIFQVCTVEDLVFTGKIHSAFLTVPGGNSNIFHLIVIGDTIFLYMVYLG